MCWQDIFLCHMESMDCRFDPGGIFAYISGVRITGNFFAWVAGPDAGVSLASPWYSNFSSGEPNNFYGNESCVEMFLQTSVGMGQWNDSPCSITQGYVVEFEPFSTSWPAVDTFVPGGSGSAHQLVTAPRTFATALALSPAPPLGRMVCWCDAHRSRVRRRPSRDAGDVGGGDWGCRSVLVVSALTP